MTSALTSCICADELRACLCLLRLHWRATPAELSSLGAEDDSVVTVTSGVSSQSSSAHTSSWDGGGNGCSDGGGGGGGDGDGEERSAVGVEELLDADLVARLVEHDKLPISAGGSHASLMPISLCAIFLFFFYRCCS